MRFAKTYHYVLIWYCESPDMTGMEFLIDFHGRDLLKEFLQHLRLLKIQLTYDRMLEGLIPAAVAEYQENRSLYGKDDFRDLANGVRSLAGLAPL